MTELILHKEKELKDKFISLLSDTTFQYLYKNEDIRSWLEYIIRKAFYLDITNYQLISKYTGLNIETIQKLSKES